MMRTSPPPGFGKPGSITAETIARLPDAMRAEGLLLLAEMGCRDIPAVSGLAPGEVRYLLDGRFQPFRRVGETDVVRPASTFEGGRP